MKHPTKKSVSRPRKPTPKPNPKPKNGGYTIAKR